MALPIWLYATVLIFELWHGILLAVEHCYKRFRFKEKLNKHCNSKGWPLMQQWLKAIFQAHLYGGTMAVSPLPFRPGGPYMLCCTTSYTIHITGGKSRVK